MYLMILMAFTFLFWEISHLGDSGMHLEDNASGGETLAGPPPPAYPGICGDLTSEFQLDLERS